MTLPVSLLKSLSAFSVTALLGAGTVHAQLKPSRGSEPLAPPGTSITPVPAAPATGDKPQPTAKEQAAITAAAAWLKLVDAGEYGKSWDECAPLFRQKVSRQTWVENLPKDRAAHGAFKSRAFSAAASRTSLPGAPDGEYVMVRFLTDFEKSAGLEELVTMTFIGGAWRPIGYLLR